MSLPVKIPKKIANGNGTNTSWDYTFKIPDLASLVLIRTDVNGVETLITTDFSVTGIGTENGGTVTYPSSGTPKVATGEKFTILRSVARAQAIKFRNQGSFHPAKHEDAYDYLTMIAQEQEEIVARSVQVAISVALASNVLPPPLAGRMIGWNAAADGFENYASLTGVAYPLTLAGDLLVGGVAGGPTRLPIGAANTFFGVDAAGTAQEYRKVGTNDIDALAVTAAKIGTDQIDFKRLASGSKSIYTGVSTGSANAQLLTTGLSLSGLATGMTFIFQAGFLNTGPATLNVDGTGIKAIRFKDVALVGGDIPLNAIITVTYDGVNFQMHNIVEKPDHIHIAASTGSANAYVLTTGRGFSAIPTGTRFSFKANHDSDGAATLNIDSVGALAIQLRGAALVSGDIRSGQFVTLFYDGTNFQLDASGKKMVYSAGDNNLAYIPNEVSHAATLAKAHELHIGRGGTLRIEFEMKAGAISASNAQVEVRRNGVLVGSTQTLNSTTYALKTQDISGWQNGDCLAIYVGHALGGQTGYVKNVRIKIEQEHSENFALLISDGAI